MRTKLPDIKKNYKLSLIMLAIILLILFAGIVFQIFRLQSSGNIIVSNLNESKDLKTLLYHLDLVENKFKNQELTVQFLDSIETQNQLIISRFNPDQINFKEFSANHSKIYNELENLIYERDHARDKRDQIQASINKGRILKNQMIVWHDEVIDNNSKIFAEDNALIPILFFISTLIGFSILVLSLYKTFDTQVEIKEKSSILDSILENTNDIANFYVPVYDDDDHIIDFKITYASKANVSLTDIPYKDLVGQLVSTTYPFIKATGLFEQIKESYLNRQYFEENINISSENKTRYFKARFIPVETGLQVMFTEFTDLYEKQKELQFINKTLSLQNKLFQEAEEVALLGSYIWYLSKGLIEMSDNVYRILGHDPQSFTMSTDKLREFTHPQDTELYDSVINEALDNQQGIDVTLRIIDKDQKVKFIYIRGNHSERDDENIIVGVIQDVSKQVRYQNQLKEQNIELVRRNTELDSFNRVASHDLQEPLRKIQMFISRIADIEESQLSARSANYFNKIEHAAHRMRNLIDNLLAFSRIDNKDYEFELVDLNEVLQHVLDTFSESVSHLDTSIKIDELPQVNAIPFLMEQLFTNLLGNALKYRAKDRVTKIVIESSKVHSKQIPQDFIKTHAYYHEIKVMDNGIGFNQADAEKIFQLFQRLHAKSEYFGTGLGLAICKKIVLKHHGHIFATSVPNKGSVFTVYLPSGKLKLLS